MTTLRRLLRFLADSLPLYSTRRLAVEWFRGQEYAIRQMGVTRGTNGQFRTLKNK